MATATKTVTELPAWNGLSAPMSMAVQVVVQRRLVTPAISVTGIADSTASSHAIIKLRPKSRGKALIWQCSSARWPIQLRGLTGTDHMLRNGRRAPNRITLSIDNVGIWTRPIAAPVLRSAFQLPAFSPNSLKSNLASLADCQERPASPGAARRGTPRPCVYRKHHQLE